ncbi:MULTISPECIES: GreA/GreB family elongation factor [Nocardiopsis]|uniref:GreA/GreB family elongation factor n=2 Tax=Nocardiopsis alba TaxID=53437 RepID=A0A7K2IRH7_9ACTN|nr:MULTISPECIES: GreA/GreB family elongation factor [Nocardiopsis]AFR06116.1 transcription elongation factor greA [Nocardiopsis alba ATCC BAA-2165]MEC3892521.1 GreA/GreB family elongation factor [Nocardiopsis sp. LDBS1602]MYR32551.1 transcription elongation factor GreAB [Nocardiopsis alba]
MSNDSTAWLTPGAHRRLTVELAALNGHTDTAEAESLGIRLAEGKDAREARIHKLEELLKHAVIGEAPPDDGVAEPGMILTVRYGGEEDTETFLLGVREGALDEELSVYSPQSPLGQALLGAVRGEERSYAVPSGRTVKVTLVDAVPYQA